MPEKSTSPMSQILKGIAENGTPIRTEVLEELASLGCDTDGLLARARAIIEDHKRSSRRQWMDVARARQAQAESIVQKVTDWGEKTVAEVETAFQQVLNGAFGQKAAIAFRNKSAITVEEKRVLLESLEILSNMPESTREPNRQDDAADT